MRLPARRIGSAHEVYRGLDYSSEIINDGVIDGTVFLGLDRRSFLSTACVKQADIQSVVNDAEELQEYRQRAAATAGKDATAAAALTAIEEYHRDTVGSNRSNSTKPLRTGTVRLEDARVRLQEANEAHANYYQERSIVDNFPPDTEGCDVNFRVLPVIRSQARGPGST